MRAQRFETGKLHYKAVSSNEENSDSINEYDVLSFSKAKGFSFDELNQLKYSDLINILLLQNPDNVVRQATQEDFDNFGR